MPARNRVVSVPIGELEPGDRIRASQWPPYRPATVTAVAENDDATVHIEFRDRDGRVGSIDCGEDLLIPVTSLIRFGELELVRAERDAALAECDRLRDLPARHLQAVHS